MDATVCPRCQHRLDTPPEGHKVATPPPDSSPASVPLLPTKTTPTAERVSQHWFYLIGNKPFGPVATDELRKALSAGELGESVQVFHQGLQGWQQAKDCLELCSPPPPPVKSQEAAEPPPQITPSIVRVLVKVKDEVTGPYTLDQLKEEIGAKRISLSDLGQVEGAADWVELKDIPKILDAILPPSPQEPAEVPSTQTISNRGGGATPHAMTLPQPAPSMELIRYATLDIRFVAGLIDFLILLVPCLLVRNAYFTALVCWLYESAFTSSSWQATPGMKVLSIQITDAQGTRISFLRASARHVAMYLSSCLMFGGFIMIPFTAKRQGLHDILAGTIVTKVSKQPA